MKSFINIKFLSRKNVFLLNKNQAQKYKKYLIRKALKLNIMPNKVCVTKKGINITENFQIYKKNMFLRMK